MVLCDEVIGATPMHRVSFPDGEVDVRTPEMTVVDEIVRRLSSVIDAAVRPVARLGERPLPVHACFVGATRDGHGRRARDSSTSSPTSSPSSSTLPVYDLDVERTHNFVAEGLVTHNSIYKFRGADFRNLVKFEEVFPEATVIVMEQNYRSSQRILDAANAVIANNAARRPKHLWTEQIGGELITRYHAEDEHDEAAFVVHEIGRLVDTEHHRFGDVAVFYRTNAQSRVVEESLVRAGVPYRVVGRREVLRPARGEGHPRLPARAGEPRRRGELAACGEHARSAASATRRSTRSPRTRRARASRSARRWRGPTWPA